MKIVIATPLFPPDIGGSAGYVKELARRLAGRHEITVVAYNHIPEKVSGVSFASVDKQRPLFLRLIRFTFVLLRELRNADILYAENGPSVELPVGLIALFTKVPLVIHIGDRATHGRTLKDSTFRYIERFAFRHADKIIEDIPRERPEILPFASYPEVAFKAYEESWRAHIVSLENIFAHVR